MSENENCEFADFGAGCFWCVEAVFERLDGVRSVVSGYEGGETHNPTYKQVCDGDTGHAEVVRITFDPEVISFEELLEVFWNMHDPTTLNRQGADHGTQYRSVIFYQSFEPLRNKSTILSLRREARRPRKKPWVSRSVFFVENTGTI